MIEIINKKNYKNGLVKYNVSSDLFHLIVDDKEICFLRLGDFILVNKFINNRIIDKFDDERLAYYSNASTSYDDDLSKIYGLFNCDKTYLNYVSSGVYYSLSKELFSNSRSNLIREFDDLLDKGFNCGNKCVIECSRIQLEEMFNYDNYDSMYVFNSNGNFLFVGNKVDGVIINDKIVPSDEKIVELDLRKRQIDAIVSLDIKGSGEELSKITSRSIDEIKKLDIYGSSKFCKYKYLIITSNGGVFSVNWFSLKFVSTDKFLLSVYNIPVEDIEKDVRNSLCKVRKNKKPF